MQEYFAIRRRYSLRRVCETQISKNTQEYRSGHNEAVLKTVRPKATGVRIPLPAPKNTNFSVGVFLFFVLNLCAVTTGEERKTVDNCFSRTKSTKQREMKQGYALSTFRLCDLTGHESWKFASISVAKTQKSLVNIDFSGTSETSQKRISKKI